MLLPHSEPYTTPINMLWVSVNMRGVPRLFRNRYYAMRHGQSQANLEGVIVSDPTVGTAGYGLTGTGMRQARESANAFHVSVASLRIYSSDFLRARQTAGLVHDILQPPSAVTLTPLLRERFFGDLNGRTDAAYADVWARDAIDPDHHDWNVESVTAVVTRVGKLLQDLESKYQEQDILLVAHGDVLQMLQAAFEGRPLSQHRQLPHLGVAEIRRLVPSNLA